MGLLWLYYVFPFICTIPKREENIWQKTDNFPSPDHLYLLAKLIDRLHNQRKKSSQFLATKIALHVHTYMYICYYLTTAATTGWRKNSSVYATTTTTATTGWPSGMNGPLRNVFWDTEVTGLTKGEEHGKIWGSLCYGVSSKVVRQGLQVVLSKTTTMSELKEKPIPTWKSPRIKRSVLPSSVLEEDSNGYGTNTTTRHN